MKKYRLNQLDIQVTRKCNLYCNHCICGDSQDMEIPFEAIDRILDCVEEIDTLFFTGGEPLLNIPAIEYTIEGIIKRKIPVYNTTITINGTILSNEFVRIFRYGAEKLYQIVVSRKQEQDLLDKLHDWRNFEVNVSTDHWHDIGLSYQAYQFYCGAFKDDLIFVGIVDSADDSDVVKYKGRAELIPGVKKVSESSKCRLNIPKVEPEDLIVCPLMITANGHIINDCSNINMTYKD